MNHKIKYLILTLCFAILSATAQAICPSTCGTPIPAGFYGGQTWTLAGSPYCVTGDIQVSLLTIEPGVCVLIDGPFKIEVLSTITAIGTPTQKITFTAKDPAVRWKGILFQNTPPGSELTHCTIERCSDAGIRLINTSAPILDHCVISDNQRSGQGGGLYADGVLNDFTMTNCLITGNTATSHGGGLRVIMSAGAVFNMSDCTVSNNTVNVNSAFGNFVGGGAYLPTLTGLLDRCRFIRNRVNSMLSGGFSDQIRARGGGVYIGNTSSTNIQMTNCVVRGNRCDARQGSNCNSGESSQSHGAGVFLGGGSLVMNNCIMSGNISTTSGNICSPQLRGGGFYIFGGTALLENCTIARNDSATGIYREGGALDLVNCIVYNNNGNSTQIGGTVSATFSDIQVSGGTPYTGKGNIIFNPVFAGPGNCVNDLTIMVGSPAQDMGNPAAIYDDLCFPPSRGSTRNDMGAHGGPLACGWNSVNFCDADITPSGGNGTVNIDDLVALLNSFGPCTGCAADIAPCYLGNNTVNIDDLVAVLNAFGPCP